MSTNVVMVQIALTLAVVVSKIARVDYPREWYASLFNLRITCWKEFSANIFPVTITLFVFLLLLLLLCSLSNIAMYRSNNFFIYWITWFFIFLNIIKLLVVELLMWLIFVYLSWITCSFLLSADWVIFVLGHVISMYSRVSFHVCILIEVSLVSRSMLILNRGQVLLEDPISCN